MANNELSGPVVTTYLSQLLVGLHERNYSYRVIFVPEKIGAIAYFSRNHELMNKNTIAGIVITCVGDDRSYSYLSSRRGNTLADRAALHVLKHMHLEYNSYSFLQRGSDERQYCSPGIDLPVCSIMKTKYQEYPEYHTSLDNLELVTPTGLYGAYEVILRWIECIEMNEKLAVTILGEPQLGKRKLYPTLSMVGSVRGVQAMMDLLAYSDGTRDILEIAETIGVPCWEISKIAEILKQHEILVAVE